MITRYLLPLTKIPAMAVRFSTIHRWDFCRASYLPRSDDKMGGTKSSEIKEVNEFREKITKFPNLLKFFIRGMTPSVSVCSDLGKTIVDGTREKRDCLPSLLEQKHISLFYCNSRKAILNPHQHRSETKFRRKSFGSLFFRKGTVHAFCVSYSVSRCW